MGIADPFAFAVERRKRTLFREIDRLGDLPES